MRVLVTGGRDYGAKREDRELLGNMIDRHLYYGGTLIHGACPTGADALADQWISQSNIRSSRVAIERFTADWERDGKAAGPIRNSRMLAEGKPDIVLAFPGGRGTADMVRKAKAAGVMVLEVTPARAASERDAT
jgi:hypothetical protein